MHAVPSKPAAPGKKAEKHESISRAKKYEGQRTETYEPPELEMPDIRPCEHLVEYLFEVGPTTGEHKLEPTQLEAWQRLTGVELDEFEATTLLSLSKEYLGMLHEGRAEDCPPPLRVEKTAEQRAHLARRMRERLKDAAPDPSTKKGLRKRANAGT